MELRDWIAVLGFSYGVASDWIGESGRFQVNSVAGLVWQWLKSTFGESTPTMTAAPKPASVSTEPLSYAKLIEDGIYHRNRLMRQPGVSEVDMALMGRHLVLTVYRERQDGA
jgi:hypothetical protein